MIEQRPTLAPDLLGFESGQVSRDRARAYLASTDLLPGAADWVPSDSREAAKSALEGRWWSPELSRARSRAEESYLAFRGGS